MPSLRPRPSGLAEEDVLRDRQVRHDHRVLEDRGDPLAPAPDVTDARRGLAAEPHLPGVRLAQRRTGSRPGSTCPRRSGRPGRGTDRRRRDRSTPRSARVVPNRLSTPVTSTSARRPVMSWRPGGHGGVRRGRLPARWAASGHSRRSGRGADAAVGGAVRRCPTACVSVTGGGGDRWRAGRRPG